MELLKIAASQLGVKEISGTENNSQIVKYAKETGIEHINTDEVPWCSTFINWCAKKAGLPMSGKENARSWINIGNGTNSPETGNIVVFWRESPESWKGHVAIFLGFKEDGKRVICLGGNQSNAVNIRDYDVEKVLAYRDIENTEILIVPKPILKKGSKGQEVTNLQLMLNYLNYNCGDVDGDFGKKTEKSLILLQANNHLVVNGIYQNKTKYCIESLLQS